jgi:hypothetical protein
LFVGHHSAIGRGRRGIISVGRVVIDVLRRLILCGGVIGQGGEDGRGEDVLE